MERSRQISPSTRKPKSPYRVDIKGIEANEILTITITHKEIPSFKEIYIFDGKSLLGKKSIHFKWNGSNVIWPKNLTPKYVK